MPVFCFVFLAESSCWYLGCICDAMGEIWLQAHIVKWGGKKPLLHWSLA